MKRSMLVMKGNFTQRQFDVLGKLWDDMQQGKVKAGLPAIQLSANGDIGAITFHDDGTVVSTSVFGGIVKGKVLEKENLVDSVLNTLSTEEQNELYNKLHNKGCRLVRR